MKLTVVTACFLFACVAVVSAQTFTGLGDLPGGEFRSLARNLSSDGSFVTGVSLSTDYPVLGEAFLWSEQSVMTGLGAPSMSFSGGASGQQRRRPSRWSTWVRQCFPMDRRRRTG